MSTPIDYFFHIGYIKFMPSKKPKLLFVVDDELIKQIDDFRFDNRIHSRAEAIRRLIREGLKKCEKKAKE